MSREENFFFVVAIFAMAYIMVNGTLFLMAFPHSVYFEGGKLYSGTITYRANTFVIGENTYLSVSRVMWQGDKKFYFDANDAVVNGKTVDFTGNFLEVPKDWNRRITVGKFTYTYTVGGGTRFYSCNDDYAEVHKKPTYQWRIKNVRLLASGPYILVLTGVTTSVVQNENTVMTTVFAGILGREVFVPMYSNGDKLLLRGTGKRVGIYSVIFRPDQSTVVIGDDTFTVIPSWWTVFFK